MLLALTDILSDKVLTARSRVAAVSGDATRIARLSNSVTSKLRTSVVSIIIVRKEIDLVLHTASEADALEKAHVPRQCKLGNFLVGVKEVQAKKVKEERVARNKSVYGRRVDAVQKDTKRGKCAPARANKHVGK